MLEGVGRLSYDSLPYCQILLDCTAKTLFVVWSCCYIYMNQSVCVLLQMAHVLSVFKGRRDGQLSCGCCTISFLVAKFQLHL